MRSKIIHTFFSFTFIKTFTLHSTLIILIPEYLNVSIIIYRERIFNEIIQIFIINSQKVYNYSIIILIFILYYICTTTIATIVRYERTLPYRLLYVHFLFTISLLSINNKLQLSRTHTYTAYLLIRLYSHTQVYVCAITLLVSIDQNEKVQK